MWKRSLALWGLLVLMMLVSGCSQNDRYILAVKSGHPVDYPSVEIGQAFENFFGSPQWRHFKADTGEEVVEFTGRCKVSDVEVTATLQFLFKDEKNFEAKFLAFNDAPQNKLMMGALLRKVYESAGGKQAAHITPKTASTSKPKDSANNEAEEAKQLLFEYMPKWKDMLKQGKHLIHLKSGEEAYSQFVVDAKGREGEAYVFHVYNIIDYSDGSGHTATIGHYKVNVANREIYDTVFNKKVY